MDGTGVETTGQQEKEQTEGYLGKWRKKLWKEKGGAPRVVSKKHVDSIKLTSC